MSTMLLLSYTQKSIILGKAKYARTIRIYGVPFALLHTPVNQPLFPRDISRAQNTSQEYYLIKKNGR